MKIEIKGYKNLNNLEVELRENAINLIMGMSGSGKSSIGEAICKKNLENNKTTNYIGEQVVKVDGSEDFDSIMYFDSETCNRYLRETENEEIYDIFVDDKLAIDEAQRKVENELKDLKNELSNSKNHYSELKIVIDDLVGKSLSKEGKLKKSSKLIAFKESIKKEKSSRILTSIQKIGLDRFAWIKTGQVYIKDDKCPYCEKKMAKKLITRIDRMIDYDDKALSKVFNHAEQLNFHIERSLSEIEKLEENIISIFKAVRDYEKVFEEVEKIQSYKVEEMNEIEISNELKKHFKSLSDVVYEFNKHLTKYKRIVGEARTATKKVLNRRTNQINEILEKMSIPYKVQANINGGRIESYKLILKEDTESKDRRDAMSTGERNIFSLVMFIFKCINTNCKLIIIDDPASYYDDYRKSEIYNLIRDKLGKRTILMMTHDSVYAKYILNNGRLMRRNDLVLYLENVDVLILKEVKKENFGIFEDFVRERINNSNDYYQKVVNLRILYEGKNNSHAYGYLSKIIHLEGKNVINDYVNEKKTTEEEILKKIEDEYSIKLPSYTGPQPITDFYNYSVLEKTFIARENKECFANFKDELNDFVHINRALRVCLNPYEFNFCTKRLYERLTKYNQITMNE